MAFAGQHRRPGAVSALKLNDEKTQVYGVDCEGKVYGTPTGQAHHWGHADAPTTVDKGSEAGTTCRTAPESAVGPVKPEDAQTHTNRWDRGGAPEPRHLEAEDHDVNGEASGVDPRLPVCPAKLAYMFRSTPGIDPELPPGHVLRDVITDGAPEPRHLEAKHHDVSGEASGVFCELRGKGTSKPVVTMKTCNSP
jgi:hypothetical protein